MQDWQEKPVDGGLTDLGDEFNKIYPRFGSTRVRQELECLKLVQEHLAHLNSTDTIDASDPLQLRGLLRSVAAQGGSVSPRQREYARAILDQMDDVKRYLEGWVEALKTLETILTVVAASRLVAFSQSFEETGTQAFEGRDYSKLVTLWDGFQAGLSLPAESITVPSDLGDPSSWPGADCVVAPPADGSAPPRELQELGFRYVSEAHQVLSGTRLRFESEEESRTYAPLVKAYWNRIQWYIERRTDPTQAEDDLDGSLSDCLIALKDVLNPIAESDGVDADSDISHETYDSYIRFCREWVLTLGYDPEPYAPYAYDAVYIYAYAIQKAQSTSPDAVKAAFIDISKDNVGDVLVNINEFAKGREALASGTDIDYSGPSGYIDFSGDKRNAHQSVLRSVIYAPKGAIYWEDDILPGNIYIRPSFSEYRAYRIVPETLCISTSGESIRITNQDSSRHRFRTTDNSHFGILGAVGGIKGERAIDTGWLDPGDEVVITLPTGLPSPYWFNLIEVDSLGNPITENPRIHILYQNRDCLGDG